MRVQTALLIILGLLMAPAQAAPLEPEAELQIGDALSPRDVQPGKLIYSNGVDGEVDRSAPPVKWPKAVRVEAGERLEVVVDAPGQPTSVELRFWNALRKNGIPKRPVGDSECFVDPFSLEVCEMSPDTTEGGYPGWAVTFESPVSSGDLYVAANFNWANSTLSQGVWAFHAKLEQ